LSDDIERAATDKIRQDILINRQYNLCQSFTNIAHKYGLCHVAFDSNYRKDDFVGKVQNGPRPAGEYRHNILFSDCFTHDMIVVVLQTHTENTDSPITWYASE